MRISVILLILLIMVSPVCNAVSPDAVKNQKILANTYQSLENLDRYHLDVDAKALIPYEGNNFNIVFRAECDAQVKPALGKGVIKLTIETPVKSITEEMTYYFEEVDKQLVCYLKTKENTWTQTFLPYNPLDMSIKSNPMEYITRITTLTEEKDADVLKVTLNGNCILKELIRQIPEARKSDIEAINQLFGHINDFDYTVRIDKKTAAKVKIDFDLSDIIAQIARNITAMPEMKAQQNEKMMKAFNNTKVSATISVSPLDDSGSIIIPAEVKAQAIEAGRRTITAKSTNPTLTPPSAKMSPVIYPSEARKNSEEGTVQLQITITETGKPENIEIFQSSGSKVLDAAALESIQQWEFSPAMSHGKPIVCRVIVPIIFKMNEPALAQSAEEIKNVQQQLNE